MGSFYGGGADGYSPTVTLEEAIIIDEQTGEEETGVEITVTNKTGSTSKTVWNGKQGAKGDKGDKGDKGERGPQGIQGETGPQGPAGADGNDYVLTNQDKSDIADLVLAQLPTTQGVQYGNTSN